MPVSADQSLPVVRVGEIKSEETPSAGLWRDSGAQVRLA